MKKRLLSILLTLVLLISLLPQFITPASASEIIHSGFCGAGSWDGYVGWAVSTENYLSMDNDYDCLLTISGTGEMKNYHYTTRSPWHAYNQFYLAPMFSSVIIKDGVTSIGNYAFFGCKYFTNISLPVSITSIGISAFTYSSSLSDVYYSGTTAEWNNIDIGDDNATLLAATIHCSDDQIHADTVTNLINMLPDSDALIVSDKEQVVSARNAYNNLSTAQKMLVENLTVLIAAEEALAVLESHVHSHKATVTAPTCTEPGYTTYTCDCGDTYKADEVDALGHDWDEGKITTRPTSTTEGVMTYTCLRANCGETKTDTLPILDLPNPFVDVKPGDFYYDAVLWAVENGITTGTSGNKFSPDATCTRSQIVTFLWRAAGKPAPTNMECNFSDVNSNDYFYQAVLWAVENGITSGTGGSKFSPLAPCNRDQVVTFLWRAAGKPAPTNTDCSFTDVDPQGFYYDAMLWAVENGITSGTGGSKFSPTAPCSRGQIVTFLYRFDNID